MGIWSKVADFAVDWVMDRLSAGAESGGAAQSIVVASDESFKKAAAELKAAISGATAEIIGKLESDKLELLGSRIRILGDLIRIGDKAEILRYQFSLREVVDYAENRVAEGKSEWVGPLLLGKGAIFSALEICSASSEHDRHELEALCCKARYDMVDLAVRRLIFEGQEIPWSEIQGFLSGTTKSASLAEITNTPDQTMNRSVDVRYYGDSYSSVTVAGAIGSGMKVRKGDILFTLVAVGSARVVGGPTTLGNLLAADSDHKLNVVSEVDGVLGEILISSGVGIKRGMVVARILVA